MHRTFSVPRLIGCWSLLIALTLHVGIHAASAQNPIQPALYAPAQSNNPAAQQIELTVGMSRTCQMTTRTDLKRVENPNSRVVKVERVADKNNEIRLVAENPGRCLVTFVDQNDRVEVQEVVVAALQGGKDTIQKMTLPKGSQKTVELSKQVLGITSTTGDVVSITPALDNPKAFTFKALAPGNTRVTFFADVKKTDILAIYDIDVPIDDRVERLRELIKKIAPYDTVEVHRLKGSRTSLNDEGKRIQEDTEAVLLTGTVSSAETIQTVVKAANAIFPPTIIREQSSNITSNVDKTTVEQLNVINQIRMGGVHQVELNVVVAVVNRSEGRNMSFSWNVSGPNWFLSSLVGGSGGLATVLTPFAPNQTTTSLTPTGSQNAPFGVLNNSSSVLGFLQVLRAEGLSKILAEPRVTTISGRPASILSGGETPIILPTGVGAPPSVTYKDFGTKVSFLPIVLGNGKIHLEVRSELSAIDQSAGVSISGVVAPGFKVRSAQVTVQMEDGQTLAIGGLIQNTIVSSNSRVPFLGDLPYLGTLFSSKSYSETEEEMIILVTPRLVDPVDCTKIPKYLPGRETRVADDFELFLEGILEAPHGQRNVFLHPKQYKAAYHGAPNAGQIPCADGSCNTRGGAGCASGNCGSGQTQATMPRMENSSTPNLATPSPMPSFPEVTGTPTSNSRVIVESELPSMMPPIREIPSSLGTPTSSLPPARQQDTRPVLPPLSGGPNGNR
jgi:Flp pilus assembly secretin CpaC